MTARPDLTVAQLDRLRQAFDTALSEPSWDRIAFVREACSGDTVLQAELSSLLEAHDASDGFLEKLAAELIAPALSAIELDDRDEAAVSEKIVSHYELIERIGGGGMGVVYKARDTRLGRTVALKFLPRRHASNPAARAGLLAEARAASTLDHPNIGVVYEIGEADHGRQFIAMAWYDGETLKDKTRKGRLAVPEAVAIAAQLGSALAAAHRAGIIHRDVKPANVIVTQSGSVKLLDFGIAKLMSDDADEMHPTAGTLGYMSPEQTRGVALDPRTDIWSLGVLMHEVLAGVRPFQRETDDLVVTAIRNEEPTDLSLLRPDVTAKLEAIVERCLRKDAAERYQTADAFCEALADVNRGGSSLESATSPGNPKPAMRRTFLSARRDQALIAFTGLAAVVAVVWGYSRYSRGAAGNTVGTITHPVSIAVMPIVDSARSDTTQYVAIGLADELRADISRIPTVTVPTYLSSRNYVGTVKPDSQVAREMGAGFLVKGSMQRQAGNAQLEMELVDGKTGRRLWTRKYDANKAVAMQVVGHAAGDILSSLRVSLSPSDLKHFSSNPTDNARAYDIYLQGRFAELSGISRKVFVPLPLANIRQAQALYAQARALDPDFARVRAKLALSHMYSAATYDTTRARLDQARLEAEMALRLDSSVSDAHDALSQYWSRYGNPQKTVEEMEIALRRAPNNVGLLFAYAIRLVGAGRWEEGAAQLDRAMLLDARNQAFDWQAATIYGRLRKNDKAMRLFNRIIEIDPADYLARVVKGHCYLRWRGSADTLAAEMRNVPPNWDEQGMATYARYTVYRVQHRYREGLAMLDHAPSDLSWDTQIYHPKWMMRADMYEGLGDSRRARLNFERARAILADSSAAHPNSPGIHSALGLAYAGLGRKKEAITEAERAMQLVPVSSNSMLATAFMGIGVETFAKVGERDRALQMIELLLSMPAGREITVPFLRVWPGFDPLRSDPRFDQLIQRFAVK